MLLHTSVMSLAPLKPSRGAPPDMLSGGGRQILASYTEFSYQGNFSDAACRLIDTLPHQSPALRSGRKRLDAGWKRSGRRRRSMGDGIGKANAAMAEEAAEKIRHHNGDHVFYLYMTATLGMLCVTDGLPVDEEVFEYLSLVERKVSAAVAPLRKGTVEKVRRAASHALIESMNTWTSQAKAGGSNSSSHRHHSPVAIRSTTPLNGQPNDVSSPDPGGRYTLELCLKEAVRRLRIDHMEHATPPPKEGSGGKGGQGLEGADSARLAIPLRSPVPLLTPQARRPRPSLRGPLSPGPRGGIITMDFDEARSNSTPAVASSLVPTEYADGILSPSRSSPNEYAGGGSIHRSGFNESEDDGSGFSPGLVVVAPMRESGEVSSPAPPMLVDLEFDSPKASVVGETKDASTAAAAAVTNLASLPAFLGEGAPRRFERSPDARRPISLGHPRRQRHHLCNDVAGLESSISAASALPRSWNTSPSLSTVAAAGGGGRLDLVRVPTPPIAQPLPLRIIDPLAVGPPGCFMGYGSPLAPQQQQQQQQQWIPIPIQQGATALGISEPHWAQRAGGGLSGASSAGVGVGSPLGLSARPRQPPSQLTWTASDPSSASVPNAAVRTPTVAEERRRRRWQEGVEQLQQRHYRSAERSATREGGDAWDLKDDESTKFRRSSSSGKLPSSLCQQSAHDPTGLQSHDHRTWGSGGVSRGGVGNGHRTAVPSVRALSPSSPANGEIGGSSASMGSQRQKRVVSVSPSGSANSPTASPLKGSRRSRTPPPTQGDHGPFAAGDQMTSANSGRRNVPGEDGRRGRSESVPPRLQSWSEPRPEENGLEIGSEAVASAGGEGRVSEDGQSQKLGILLPLDYSGMVTGGDDAGGGEAPLLRELDGMARNALKAQVEVSSSDDELLSVFAKFRHTLMSIPLPPPAAVDYDQALKDAQRESIEVNGRMFQGNVEELLITLRDLVGPLVFGDESLMRTVCQDIVRASSRTSSGGDTYMVVAALLSRPAEGDILTPSGVESAPIGISVDPTKGEVVITVENRFLLRRNAMDCAGNVKQSAGREKGAGTLKAKMVKARGHLDELVEQTAEQFRKMKVRRDVWGGPGWSLDGSMTKKDRGFSEESAPDEAMGISILGGVEVYLRLLDGSSKRRLRITCPDVERCPPECILLGAGTNEANGTYELTGFRNGAPIYNKGNDVTIAKKCVGGKEGWIIGRPPNRVLYGQPGNAVLPPEVHWSVMNGGTGQNPPPTLMMHSHRLAKETIIDIRQMPSPGRRWAIGPNVTFPDDRDCTLMNSALAVRLPAPATPPNAR